LKADADQKDLEADKASAAKTEAEKELEEAKANQEQGKQALVAAEFQASSDANEFNAAKMVYESYKLAAQQA